MKRNQLIYFICLLAGYFFHKFLIRAVKISEPKSSVYRMKVSFENLSQEAFNFLMRFL